MNTSDLKSFHYLENGSITFSILDTIKTSPKLDTGIYNLAWLEYPESKLQLTSNVDGETIKMHEFPDKKTLDNFLNAFFNKKIISKMKTLGFYHKGGILLHGKEGTGKTTIIKNYVNKIVKDNDGIVFYVNGNGNVIKCWAFISEIRKIQNNPIVVIFEEFDTFLGTNNMNVGPLKTILDGNHSMDNCLVFATTNYIDKIPDALKKRPSRFKYVLDIEGIQCEKEIVELLKNMIGDMFTDSEINSFASDLKGSTLDLIKQFSIDKIMDLSHYNSKNNKKIGYV